LECNRCVCIFAVPPPQHHANQSRSPITSPNSTLRVYSLFIVGETEPNPKKGQAKFCLILRRFLGVSPTHLLHPFEISTINSSNQAVPRCSLAVFKSQSDGQIPNRNFGKTRLVVAPTNRPVAHLEVGSAISKPSFVLTALQPFAAIP